jgi:hypothetical protein
MDDDCVREKNVKSAQHNERQEQIAKVRNEKNESWKSESGRDAEPNECGVD